MIKSVTQEIKSALATGQYHYAIRFDIKSYCASIDRKILFEQLKQHFDDKQVLHYLNAIVYHAVDDRGCISVPTKGIPLRSGLSPFFGALYLASVDKAFGSMDVFYRRYVDDGIILIKNRRQYAKAKRRLFEVLRSLS